MGPIGKAGNLASLSAFTGIGEHMRWRASSSAR